MKIILSRNQWEKIGEKAGWTKPSLQGLKAIPQNEAEEYEFNSQDPLTNEIYNKIFKIVANFKNYRDDRLESNVDLISHNYILRQFSYDSKKLAESILNYLWQTGKIDREYRNGIYYYSF